MEAVFTLKLLFFYFEFMKIHCIEIVLDYETLNIFADGQISDMYEQFTTHVENIHFIFSGAMTH